MTADRNQTFVSPKPSSEWDYYLLVSLLLITIPRLCRLRLMLFLTLAVTLSIVISGINVFHFVTIMSGNSEYV